jgi:hypothetical protein
MLEANGAPREMAVKFPCVFVVFVAEVLEGPEEVLFGFKGDKTVEELLLFIREPMDPSPPRLVAPPTPELCFRPPCPFRPDVPAEGLFPTE